MLMGLGPCRHPGPIDIPDGPSQPVGPALGEAAGVASKTGQAVSNSSGSINASANNVKTNADIAASKAGEAKKELDPHLKIIKKEADSIIKEAARLQAAGVDMSKLAIQLQNLALNVQTLTERSNAQESAIEAEQKKNDKLQKDLEQALSDKTAALRKAMIFMIIAGAIIIAICMTLFFTGNPKAIGGAVAGIVLVSTALAIMAITKYMWLFGLVGGVGVIVVLGVMIYHVFEYLQQKRGLEEVVETSEELKKHLPEDKKHRVFGPPGERGLAGQIQSKHTENIVRRIKNRLRAK